MDVGFRHVIGKATIKEGFAVPRNFEDWIAAPPKGCKRKINLVFNGNKISAVLRRIDNEKGSVQVKYESQECEPFRIWLSNIFHMTDTIPTGNFFELHRIGIDTFEVIPSIVDKNAAPTLHIEQWLFHQVDDTLIKEDTSFAEIPAVVQAIPFMDQQGQSFYNQAFANSFASWQWQSERRVIKELGLKSDFMKDDIQVEVEFGNARTYYQDFIKFLLGNHYCKTALGVLIVPSTAFAKHLCEVGRQRAVAKGRIQYSGMIDFDKVHREIRYLEFMLSMPIAIAGISSIAIS